MVKSEIYYQLLSEKLEDKVYYQSFLCVECGTGFTSQVIGHKRKNIINLKKRYGFKDIKVKENPYLGIYELKLEIKEENS